jgi:hypothetical protein
MIGKVFIEDAASESAVNIARTIWHSSCGVRSFKGLRNRSPSFQFEHPKVRFGIEDQPVKDNKAAGSPSAVPAGVIDGQQVILHCFNTSRIGDGAAGSVAQIPDGVTK